MFHLDRRLRFRDGLPRRHSASAAGEPSAVHEFRWLNTHAAGERLRSFVHSDGCQACPLAGRGHKYQQADGDTSVHEDWHAFYLGRRQQFRDDQHRRLDGTAARESHAARVPGWLNAHAFEGVPVCANTSTVIERGSLEAESASINISRAIEALLGPGQRVILEGGGNSETVSDSQARRPCR